MIKRILHLEAWRVLSAIVVIGLLAGVFVMISGIISVRASSGHWPVTRWFLEFSKSRSVHTYSLGTEVPPLDDPALILKGAVHYDVGCRSCHGSPGLRYPRIPAAMAPAPPYLGDRTPERSPAEFFEFVKHGIKFTGMPAWPAQGRDDEVWAVVAFLLQFPELDEPSYRRLVGGDSAQTAPIEELGLAPTTMNTVVHSCARCHGRDGIARGDGAFPDLAGQREEYLFRSLSAYAAGVRHSGIMEPIAAGLDEHTMRELSAYYSTKDPRPAREAQGSAADLALGSTIARVGLPDERVPACIECHDPLDRAAKDSYPSLAGQEAGYIALQLELFKERRRGGTQAHHLMHPVADQLDATQIRAVAAYFESLSVPPR